MSVTAALIGAGVGVASIGASLYSQYKNMKSQADTNATNYKIHQEQMAQQERQYQQQIAENRYLQDLAYERNLPKEQVKALKEAGINPALALENGALGNVSAQSGSAPSPNSIPSAPQMVAPQMGDLGQGINNAYAMYLSTAKLDQDLSAENRRLDMQELELYDKMETNKENRNLISANTKKVMDDLQYQRKTAGLREEGLRLANDKIRYDGLYQEELYKAQIFANEVAPEMNELQKKVLASEIAKASAVIAEINSRKDLNDKEKDLVCKKISEQILLNKDLPKRLHNDNAIKVATYKHIM